MVFFSLQSYYDLLLRSCFSAAVVMQLVPKMCRCVSVLCTCRTMTSDMTSTWQCNRNGNSCAETNSAVHVRGVGENITRKRNRPLSDGRDADDHLEAGKAGEGSHCHNLKTIFKQIPCSTTSPAHTCYLALLRTRSGPLSAQTAVLFASQSRRPVSRCTGTGLLGSQSSTIQLVANRLTCISNMQRHPTRSNN